MIGRHLPHPPSDSVHDPGMSFEGAIDQEELVVGGPVPGAEDNIYNAEALIDGLEEVAESLLAFPQAAFRALAVGNIAGDLGRADDAALPIEHRRDGQRNVEQRAVLAAADGCEVV